MTHDTIAAIREIANKLAHGEPSITRQRGKEILRMLDEAEKDAENPSDWVSTEEALPETGRVVEIMQVITQGEHTAKYQPDENSFFPWELINYAPNGIWRRSAEAVTHWRYVQERGIGHE